MPIAWSWLLIDLQVPTVHCCILISSVSFTPFLEGGGYWLLFLQDLSQWIADFQFISQKRNTLSAGLICHYQHTFVSGPSIQLAFLTFNGTGTLHDPMAMSCFMFLCLDQISYARDTWNLFIQLLRTIAQNKLTKNENPSNKLNKKRQIQLKQRNREANSKKKLKTTPRMW